MNDGNDDNHMLLYFLNQIVHTAPFSPTMSETGETSSNTSRVMSVCDDGDTRVAIHSRLEQHIEQRLRDI